MTGYNHQITMAVPKNMKSIANNLAIIIGDSAKDIETFKSPKHKDAKGELFFIICFRAKSDFLVMEKERECPKIPDHAKGKVDTDLAKTAIESINKPEGIMVAIDEDPFSAIRSWGMTKTE